jgi:hypothetical protein
MRLPDVQATPRPALDVNTMPEIVSYDTNSPRTPAEGAPLQLSFQELWKAADIERGRAEISRAWCVEKIAREATPAGRDTYQRAVDGYTHTIAAFEKIMRLLDIMGTDFEIKRRLWEIAEAEAAERAAEGDHPDAENNAS